MEVSALVPWRSQDPARIRAWEFCKREWELMGVEVCEGVDAEDGPFNTARAANNAFLKSTKPYVMTMGADCIPDRQAVEESLHKIKTEGLNWVPMFDKTSYFDESATNRIFETKRWWDEQTDPKFDVPFQTGVMFMKREVYEEAGGHDERFTGWGGEDAAFRQVIYTLNGNSDPLPLTLKCLWHDPGRRGTMSKRNFELCHTYEALQSREELLEYLATRPKFI